MVDDLKLLVDECKLRGYSQKTINSYQNQVSRFLKSGMSPREYLLKLAKTKSVETVRAAGFAIKFYLRTQKTPEISLILRNLPNMKREKKLPPILSKEEINKLIKATNNIKHKLMIQIGYSSGLRVSELINLKWADIDLNRNIIHIKKAKGKKDRIVMLSRKVKNSLDLLDSETKYIFVTNRNKKYSQRTIQKILENTAKKAGMRKRVTPHTLRHSFATHLLENGTDIRYIRDLLGHSDISTTLIYTKVSNKNIRNIKSPLDD
jgi:integrase/recombinase XerD